MSSGPIGVVEIGRVAARGEQDEPQRLRSAASPRTPANEAWRDERDLIEVVHAGAAEGAVGDGKAGRLDDMRLDAEAGASRRIVPVFCGMSGS